MLYSSVYNIILSVILWPITCTAFINTNKAKKWRSQSNKALWQTETDKMIREWYSLTNLRENSARVAGASDNDYNFPATIC